MQGEDEDSYDIRRESRRIAILIVDSDQIFIDVY